jgi:hypothetical protein
VGEVGGGGAAGEVGAGWAGGVAEPLGLTVVGSGEGVEVSAPTVIGSAAQLLDAALSSISPE